MARRTLSQLTAAVLALSLPFAGCSGGDSFVAGSGGDGGTTDAAGDARATDATSGAASDAGGCNGGQTNCGGACVDLMTSPSNCGHCGNACPSGESCSGGACGCSSGQTPCSGACVDLPWRGT